jgi:hypothetical protein
LLNEWVFCRAYDRAAIKFRGLDADINFHINDYQDEIKHVSISYGNLPECNLLTNASYISWNSWGLAFPDWHCEIIPDILLKNHPRIYIVSKLIARYLLMNKSRFCPLILINEFKRLLTLFMLLLSAPFWQNWGW